MSIIYLESTLQILAQKDLESTQDLVSKGQIKETEEQAIKYLKIED